MSASTSLPITFEEYCAFYEKSTENKAFLFKQHQYAMKERQRYRDKDKRAREKIKAAKALLPPVPKKKPGPKGPWKHKKVVEIAEQDKEIWLQFF